jgi:hypothetical protein
MESYRHLHRSRYFGDLLYAIGLASLVPLWDSSCSWRAKPFASFA